MKAVVIEKPGRAAVQEVPEPIPKNDEVLIRPRVCGVCGTDVHIFHGDFMGNYPVIPCHEFAGEVMGVGRHVNGFNIGDAVAVDPNIRCGECVYCRRGEVNLCEKYDALGVTRAGGFAQRVCAPSGQVHKLARPDFTAGAFAEPLACVLCGQSRLDISPNSEVLIWGAGAIGLLHMLVFQKEHASRVTIVDLDGERCETALRLGAFQALTVNESLDSKLNKINLKGWDIAVDATGKPEAVEKMFAHLRSGGQALLFGVYPENEALPVSLFRLFRNDWKIAGSFTYRHEFAQAVRLVSSGEMDMSPLADHVISLDAVPDILSNPSAGKYQVHFD